MYQIGDLVLYGGTGVCKVLDITTQDAPEDQREQLFYILGPLFQTCTIFAPVHTTRVFMRPIISKDEAEELINMIPSIHPDVYHSRGINELATLYKKTLSTHDCLDLLKLTISIYSKKRLAEQQKRKLGAVDERYMRRAEELLFGELSAALDISKDRVAACIADSVAKKQHAMPDA